MSLLKRGALGASCVLLSILGLLLANGLAAEAESTPPDPGSNITMPAPPADCSTSPTGTACENAAVSDLNAARAVMGLGPYILPADFLGLSPQKQMFILVNDDRAAYGLQPIIGLNTAVDAAAQQGMLTDSDPTYPSGLPAGWSFFSNYAYGFQNVSFAYYFWVYADGPGGGNVDCPTAGSPGCWGHRHVAFAFSGSTSVAMGAAVGKDNSNRDGYAMELVDTQSGVAYEYTWAQAVADGAGPSTTTTTTTATTTTATPPTTTTATTTTATPPTTTATAPTTTTATTTTTSAPPATTSTATTKPVPSPPPLLHLTVKITGRGRVIRMPVEGNGYKVGATVKLLAKPRAAWQLRSWGGACSGSKKPVCSLKLNHSKHAGVVFVKKAKKK